ncbi:hypothetical protein C0993_004929 [Termitomyces sp. T159_Od127]|nr:hypothetical protein C0993_004929 [Termitomyces sp. T159_Od127]
MSRKPSSFKHDAATKLLPTGLRRQIGDWVMNVESTDSAGVRPIIVNEPIPERGDSEAEYVYHSTGYPELEDQNPVRKLQERERCMEHRKNPASDGPTSDESYFPSHQAEGSRPLPPRDCYESVHSYRGYRRSEEIPDQPSSSVRDPLRREASCEEHADKYHTYWSIRARTLFEDRGEPYQPPLQARVLTSTLNYEREYDDQVGSRSKPTKGRLEEQERTKRTPRQLLERQYTERQRAEKEWQDRRRRYGGDDWGNHDWGRRDAEGWCELGMGWDGGAGECDGNQSRDIRMYPGSVANITNDTLLDEGERNGWEAEDWRRRMMEARKRYQFEDLRRQAVDARKTKEEAIRLAEEACIQAEETKEKGEEVIEKEEEAKKKEEEVHRQAEEPTTKEEVRRKEVAAKEEAHRVREEACKREQDIKYCEEKKGEELRRREWELKVERSREEEESSKEAETVQNPFAEKKKQRRIKREREAVILSVLKEEKHYKRFLRCVGEDAQKILDGFQSVYAREAILWGQLRHPNVLPFYGLHLHLSQIAFVAPWAENGSLNDYLDREPDANRMLLASLNYLHENNIIHGDLNSRNILVDGSGKACLGDFGLSGITDEGILKWTTQSAAGSNGGTRRWQAPEIHNSDADVIYNTKESDIFAWASTCYEIFTGHIPFYTVSNDLKILHGVNED